jgi:hypothetical protein
MFASLRAPRGRGGRAVEGSSEGDERDNEEEVATHEGRGYLGCHSRARLRIVWEVRIEKK